MTLTNAVHRQQSLPPALKLDNFGSNASETVDDHENVLRFILEGHLIDCYEMIYWPFISDAMAGDVLSDFKHFIRKALDYCVLRIKSNKRGFYHRHHGTWLMIRSCTRSALVLLAASRSAAKEMLDDGWQGSVQSVLELLRYWEDEAGDVKVWRNILDKLLNDSESVLSLRD
jgi:hypothetical protein